MVGGYPEGMDRADLIHVGEIEDPFERYYEQWDDVTDEQLEDFIMCNPETFTWGIHHDWTLRDYIETWKEENVDYIKGQFEKGN